MAVRPPPRKKKTGELRRFLGFLDDMRKESPGDVRESLSSLLPAGKMITKAVAKDVSSLGPSQWADPFSVPETVKLAGQMAVGMNQYGMRTFGQGPDQTLLMIGTDGKIYRTPGSRVPGVKDTPDDILKDLRKEPRGLELLRQDPLLVPLQFVPVAGVAGRGMAVTKLARQIESANKGMSRARALDLARHEVKKPGYVKSKDLEGGIPDRIIESKHGSTPGRMRSRSVAGRMGQNAYDRMSARLDETRPGSRFASSSRVKAAEAKAMDRAKSSAEGKILNEEVALNKLMDRTRRQRFGRRKLTENQQDVMRYALISTQHPDLTPTQAAKANIALGEAVLRGGISSKMSVDQVNKLVHQLDIQLDEVTGEQAAILKAYKRDMIKASILAARAEADVFRLATRLSPDERAALRASRKLDAPTKRSAKEIEKLQKQTAEDLAEQVRLSDKIDDILTNPNLSASKRNRDLSSATRQLTTRSEKLAARRLELRDALSWGLDLSDESRRARTLLDQAEAFSEDALRTARRKQGDADEGEAAATSRYEWQEEIDQPELLAHERSRLDEAWEELVANPRSSRPATETEASMIENSMSSLQRMLENPPDEATFRHAAAGLRELTKWNDELGRRIAKIGLDEEGAAAIDDMFDARQKVIGDEMVRRGILTREQADGAYFPHYSMWQNPREVGRGTGARGDMAQEPSLHNFILNDMDNDLQLLQTGMVDYNPATLGNMIRNRLRYLSTYEKVDNLFWNAPENPIDLKEIPKNMMVVRRPGGKKKVSDRFMMALTDPTRYADNVSAENAPTPWRDAADANATLTSRGLRDLNRESLARAAAKERADSPDPDDMLDDAELDLKDSLWDGDGNTPDWATDPDNFRLVPKRVAKAALGDAMHTPSKSDTLAFINAVNLALRMSILYAPYGGARYVTRNAIQNATLMALTNPGAFKNGTTAVRLQRGLPEQRNLFREIATEGGTVAAQAGMPSLTHQRASLPSKLESRAADSSSFIGNALGDLADEPFRVAMWISEARKYDFDTPEEWATLMRDPKHTTLRHEISQRVRENLMDFDAASPGERRAMNRILFLYPFLRASSKWPFMYAREYPVRAAAGLTVANQLDRDEEDYENMPDSLKEKATLGNPDAEQNWNIWDPTSPFRELAQAAGGMVTAFKEGSVDQGLKTVQSGVLDQFHPLIGFAAEPGTESLKRMVPLWGTQEQMRKDGTLTERGIRFLGMEIKAPKHVREETQKKKNELNTAIAWGNATGRLVANGGNLAPTFQARQTWDELNYRAKRAAKDQGFELTEKEITKLFAEYVGSTTGLRVPTTEQLDGMNKTQREAWRRGMEDAAWGPIEEPIEDMSRTLGELAKQGYTQEDLESRVGVDLSAYSDVWG